MFLFFVSCHTGHVKNDSNIKGAFQKYKSKFKPLQLPLVLKLADLYKEKLPTYNAKSTDTMFAHDNALIYGMLPDTAAFYGLITLEHYGPILTTYDKTGRTIFTLALKVRDCPADVCYTYWAETTTIDKDLAILCADTIKTTVPEGKNPTGCTDQHYCLYKDGKVNADGTIVLTEEKTAVLADSKKSIKNKKKK